LILRPESLSDAAAHHRALVGLDLVLSGLRAR
jgi:hypothetical protein